MKNRYVKNENEATKLSPVAAEGFTVISVANADWQNAGSPDWWVIASAGAIPSIPTQAVLDQRAADEATVDAAKSVLTLKRAVYRRLDDLGFDPAYLGLLQNIDSRAKDQGKKPGPKAQEDGDVVRVVWTAYFGLKGNDYTEESPDLSAVGVGSKYSYPEIEAEELV